MSRLEPRHPLLGFSTPTVGDLLERSTAPARATLEAAALLARWRVDGTRTIEATDAELRSEPWPTRPTKQPVTDDIESPDMLRALLALHSDDVVRVLLVVREPTTRRSAHGGRASSTERRPRVLRHCPSNHAGVAAGPSLQYVASNPSISMCSSLRWKTGRWKR